MKKPARYKFRLYIAGDAPNSMMAEANLRRLCDEYLPGRHQIEIIDVLSEPRRALEDGVFLTPMLVKLFPLPVRNIIGSLDNHNYTLQALGINRHSL